jgi:hypothetical protein
MSGRNNGRDADDAPLSERAATAARAELRGERIGILGATGETTLRSLVRAHRVPARWTVPHHISPDIDAERDLLTDDLEAAKVVTSIYEVTGIGPTLDGRNGEGDPYYTDGEIKISVLVQGCDQRSTTVSVISNPPIVDLKNRAWSVVEKLLLPEPPARAANRETGRPSAK